MSETSLYVFPRKESRITTTGLAPVIGYEPWTPRTIESVKQSLVDGNPVLMRVHSAADYPCSTNELGYVLDMESHAVLIVGYNDEEEAFDVVDPWNKQWGGAHGGMRKLTYEMISVCAVNATYDKMTRIALPVHNVRKCVDVNGNVSLKLRIGYYVPKGYIIDEKDMAFTAVNIAASLVQNGCNKTYEQHLKGRWIVGEYAETSIALGRDLSGDLDVEFSISATIEGKRPYSYSDTIEFSFVESVSLEKKLESFSVERVAV